MNFCHCWRLVVVFTASLAIAVDALVPIRAPVVSTTVRPSSLSLLQSRTGTRYQLPAPPLHMSSSTETEDAKRALIGDDSAYFALEEQVRDVNSASSLCLY